MRLAVRPRRLRRPQIQVEARPLEPFRLMAIRASRGDLDHIGVGLVPTKYSRDVFFIFFHFGSIWELHHIPSNAI